MEPSLMSSLNPSRSPLETLENESESAEPLLQTEISNSKATGKGAIDFDRVLQHVGPMGAWQFWHLFLLFWVPICGGIAVVTFAFTGYVPDYRCAIPQCENVQNATYLNDNGAYVNLTLEALGHSKTGKSCLRITTSKTSCENYMSELISLNNISKPKTEKCSSEELVFDRSIVHTSITEDYALTCDDLVVQSIFKSLYLGGMLIGSFLIGMLSDKFGRLNAMILSIFLVGGSGVLMAFVKNRILFGILRITCGMGGMGCYMVPAVIAAETTLPTHKIITTTVPGIAFILGELIFTFQAYFIRDWLTLQLVAFLPMLLLLGLYFLVPESTRWLIANDRLDEAKKNIQKRASMNKKIPVPEELLVGKVTEFTATTGSTKKSSLIDLFKHRTILYRTLNMFLQWFSATMVYYGLLFGSTSLYGDPYVNFTLVVLAELPSMFLYLKLPHMYGRRNSLVASQAISAICCISGGLLIENSNFALLQITLVMIGRLFAGLGFTLVYLYTLELYPTDMRNTAIGTCSSIARAGGVIAILMENLKEFWPPMSMVIFGTVSIIAAVLAFKFPETRNDKLPESIDEALKLGQNIRRTQFGLVKRKENA